MDPTNSSLQQSAVAFVRGVRHGAHRLENKMSGMNRKIVTLGLAGMLMSLAMGFAAAQAKTSYVGVVTASQIASTGGLSGIGVWMKKLNCHDDAECSRQLVRAGGKYVLLTSKGTYQLSDQTKAAQFAGMRVNVTGEFDSPKKTIEVADVQVYNPTTASVSFK